MDETKVWEEFPNKIDLGREENVPTAVCAPDSKGGKTKCEKRTYYPSLYINGVDGLAGLEKEGWALVRYRTRSLTVRTEDDDKNGDSGMMNSGPSVDLEIRELCLPEDSTSEGDGLKKAIAKFAKSKGYATDGSEGSDETEEDDEG